MARWFSRLFLFEIKRMSSKRVLLFMGFILMIVLLSAYDGNEGYITCLEDQAAFQKAEIEKIKGYKLYSQYGGFGFNIMLVPSPFAALSKRGGLLISNVNASEILKIFKHFKGRGAIYGGTGNLDFFGLMLLWSIFALLYGYEGIKRRDYFLFLSDFGKDSFWYYVAFKFIMLTLLNTILLLVVSVFMLLMGLNLFNIYLLAFLLIFLILAAFFLSIGVIIGYSSNRLTALIYIFIVISTCLFLIPWGNSKIDELNARKIENLFDFELDNQRIYLKVENNLLEKYGTIKSTDVETDEMKKEIIMHLNAEFKMILDRNTEYKNQISDILISHQRRSLFFPVLLYFDVASELSGKGGLSFKDFFEYCIKKKKGFVFFYVLNRHAAKGKPQIIPFAKGDDNIFLAAPRLPHNFSLGIFFSLLWVVGLLLIGYRLHIKKISSGSTVSHSINTKGLNPAFTRCRDEGLRNEISRYYDRQPNVCSIDKINPDDFRFSGVTPSGLFFHLCSFPGVVPDTARENLKILGIEKVKEIRFEKDKPDQNRETILKIYAAVKTAMNVETIVVNDFVKRESKEFESDFFRLLVHLVNAGKQVIYLSTEMLKTNSHMAGKVKIDYAVTYPIDLEKVTLR